MNNFIPAAAILAMTAMLTGCSEPSFKIKGEIQGADNTAVVLEKPDFHGLWIAVDSTRTSSDGSFSLSQAAPAAPEIYRLAVDGKYVYFPVDSTETISLQSTLEGLGRSHSLAGSENAELLSRFDRDLVALPQSAPADSLEAFKRRVFMNYMHSHPGSVVTYYILTKTIGDKPLFDPAGENDYKYFSAVANGYQSVRPDDPHTALLVQTSMNAMRAHNNRQGIHHTIQAEEIKMIDFVLNDEDGKAVKLSDVAGKGKPTLLVFSLMTQPESPEFNRQLMELYNSRGGNLNIYQVSLDTDQYAWRDAARNLPWVTVFDPEGAQSSAAAQYNVSAIPVIFVYNASGELCDRATDFTSLRAALSKL